MAEKHISPAELFRQTEQHQVLQEADPQEQHQLQQEPKQQLYQEQLEEEEVSWSRVLTAAVKHL